MNAAAMLLSINTGTVFGLATVFCGVGITDFTTTTGVFFTVVGEPDDRRRSNDDGLEVQRH